MSALNAIALWVGYMVLACWAAFAIGGAWYTLRENRRLLRGREAARRHLAGAVPSHPNCRCVLTGEPRFSSVDELIRESGARPPHGADA